MKGALQTFTSYLLCDWIASAGAVVVTTSAVIFLTFAFPGFSNPYYGIIVFLVAEVPSGEVEGDSSLRRRRT